MEGFNIEYFLHSIRTRAYWKYALFSSHARATFFSCLGAIWLLLEMLSFFHLIEQTRIPSYGIFLAIGLSILFVIFTRRPVSKICYKIPHKDITVEVVIGDLFSINGQKIISTNNTFDTDMSSGLIAANSLQGQFSNKYFPGNIGELDKKIEDALNGIEFSSVENPLKKDKRYDIGTVAKIISGREKFYLLAMAELNSNGTADSGGLPNIRRALDAVWKFIASHGENDPIVIPLLGTGRGRVSTPRKKMIEIHAQSFIDASKDRIFSNKLIIVIWPDDAKNFEINLFEIKDYLVHSLEY
jgi:hypothetical protein